MLKLLRQNVQDNISTPTRTTSKPKTGKPSRSARMGSGPSNLDIMELDWETSDVSSIMRLLDQRPDVLLAIDCVFNPTIIQPFVSTLKEFSTSTDQDARPVISIIAQQLRSPDVFTEWLEAMLQDFRVWRVNDKELSIASLGVQEGYVVHICILK